MISKQLLKVLNNKGYDTSNNSSIPVAYTEDIDINEDYYKVCNEDCSMTKQYLINLEKNEEIYIIETDLFKITYHKFLEKRDILVLINSFNEGDEDSIFDDCIEEPICLIDCYISSLTLDYLIKGISIIDIRKKLNIKTSDKELVDIELLKGEH